MSGNLTSASGRTRVVHLIGELGHGGSERQLLLLLRELRAALDSTVAVINPPREGRYRREIEAAGARLWEMPSASASVAARLLELLRLFRRERPHAVLSWTIHDNAYAAVAGRLARVPVRWGSVRGTLGESLRPLGWISRRLCVGGVQRLVVNAAFVQRELLEAGVPEERILLLRNGCDAASFAGPGPVAEIEGVPPSSPVVGIVGNLRQVKNPALFLEMLARLPGEHSDVFGVMVGAALASEQELPSRLEAMARDLGVAARFVRTGFRDDVPALLRRFSVLCVTSRSEGMPNVVLEAMASGIPVVGTDVGGVAEAVVDGETGFVVPSGDAGGMAAAVARLLGDDELARHMGARGRERVERLFDPGRQAARLAEELSDALLREIG